MKKGIDIFSKDSMFLLIYKLKKKKCLLTDLFIFLIVFLTVCTFVNATPILTFENPTPANATTTSNTSVQINISIEEQNLDTFILNWNEINHTFFYDDLFVFYGNNDTNSTIKTKFNHSSGKFCYDETINNDSLLLYFNFNNRFCSGNYSSSDFYDNDFIRDFSQYGNNGTINSNGEGMTWSSTQGKYGGSFTFDGVNDEINLNNEINFGNSSILWWQKSEFWATWNMMFGKDGATNSFFGYYDPDNYFKVWTTGGDNDNWNIDADSYLGVWTHFALISNSTSFELYINGVSQGVISNSGDLLIDTIGYGYNIATYHFNGTIDEVQIYNQTLSAEEIGTYYNSTLQKINNAQWYFYSNITNLNDGNYTYYGWANNTGGNENQSETRTLIIDATIKTFVYTLNTEKTSARKDQNYFYIEIEDINVSGENFTFYLYNSSFSLINSTTTTNKYVNFTNMSYGTYYYNVTMSYNSIEYKQSYWDDTVTTFGNSITEGYWCSNDGEDTNFSTCSYPYIFSNNRSWVLTNEGVSSQQLQNEEIAGKIFSLTTTENNRFTLAELINDYGYYANNELGESTFWGAINSTVAFGSLLQSERINFSNEVTYTGTWNDNIVYGNIGKYTTEDSATATFNVTGDVIYIGYIRQDSPGIEGSFNISIDGINQGEYFTNGTSSSGLGTAVSYAPSLIRFSGLNNTEHAVVINVSIGTSDYVYLHWAAGINTSEYKLRPLFYLGEQTYLVEDGYALGIYNSPTNETIDKFNNFLYITFNTLYDDGLNIVYVNLSNFDPYMGTFDNADDVHPNSTGHFDIGNLFVDAIKEYEDHRKIILADLNPPVVTILSPLNNSGDNDGNITFIYNVSDSSNITNCSLMINRIKNQTNLSITKNVRQNFTVNNLASQSYTWSINCTDSVNYIGSSGIKTIAVVKTTNFLGKTTDLSQINISNITNLIIDQPSLGYINFSEVVDLSLGGEINEFVNISFNKIEINSTALPALNKSARLILYDLSYDNPRILKDNFICSDCTEISYSNGDFVFEVNSFSVYSTEETPISAINSGSGWRDYFKLSDNNVTKNETKIFDQEIILSENISSEMLTPNEESNLFADEKINESLIENETENMFFLNLLNIITHFVFWIKSFILNIFNNF